jgi:hypothetical protein
MVFGLARIDIESRWAKSHIVHLGDQGGKMTKCVRAVLFVSLSMCLFGGRLCAAQKSKLVPSAPIPSLILSAKKVFVSNAGGDESLFGPQYTGGPDRLYDEFYAGVKSWGRYELVGSPEDADLVFEIRLTVVQPQRSEALSSDYNQPYDSQFQFVIRDVKTHTILWGLTEHAQTAVLQSNRDKNFEQALAAILSELRRIAGAAQAAAQPPSN